MKKKITALALVICLMATAVVGATLAYFTDISSATNTFTVGNVDIEVSETNAINGEAIDGTQFTNVMPGDEITKTAVVKNNSSDAAYVRVVVHLNNQLGLYNMLLDETGDTLAVDMSEVMPGWNFTPEKANPAADSGMRYLWKETDTDGVDVIAIDVAMANRESGKYLADAGNYIITDAELAANNAGRVQMSLTEDSAYRDILYYDDLAWVFYLKMDAGASYKLFDGINPSDEFDRKQMSFFDDYNANKPEQYDPLVISVCADAIQSSGFEADDEAGIAKAAFEALEGAHPLSSWGLK